jgi:hypothetical protein
MNSWNIEDEASEPLSKRPLRVFGIAIVAAAIVSAIIYPMSWPLLLLYSCLGGAIGFLGTLDKLPGILSVAILLIITWKGYDWMASIAPQWHSTWWQPGLTLLGAAYVVYLRAFARRALVQSPRK